MNQDRAADIRGALAHAADPTRAPAMQAYMKSALPFRGVETPRRRRVVAEVMHGRACKTAQELSTLVLSLWRGADHREDCYAALDLLRLAGHRKLLSTELLPLAKTLLANATWWDFNDELSGVLLPKLLLDAPDLMKPLLRQWARSAVLWDRRAAMLAQRRLKGDDFDAPLFYDCLLPSVGDPLFGKEFFIQKGMGWALRERSYAAPEEVRAFCTEYGDRLAPLTVREALKALRRKA